VAGSRGSRGMIPGIVGSATALPLKLGAVLWLDAADTATITASGLPLRVSQWDNKGSLSNFTQSNGAVQPTTGASTLNGLNVLDFAGDRLTAVNQNEWKFLHDGTDWIMGAAWQAGTTASPNAAYALFGSNAAATANVGSSFFYDDRSAFGFNDTIAWQITRGVAGTITAILSQGNNQNVHPSGVPVVVTGFARPSAASASDRLLAQIDTDTPRANNTQTNAASTANPSFALQIGAGGNNFGPLTGKIAELVIVSGANATETNREALRDYLNAKWSVY
jgi:hypothetical protein